MQANDIGVVSHALDRFKEYAPAATKGVPDDIIEEELKKIVVERFASKSWTTHILDELVEAWLIRMNGARVGGIPIGGTLTALVKGDDDNPLGHLVVVTFMKDDAVHNKFRNGHWQRFNGKKMIPRSSSLGLQSNKPLTHKIGEQLKGLSVEANIAMTDVKKQNGAQVTSPVAPAEPKKLVPMDKPIRLLTYKLNGKDMHVMMTSDRLPDIYEELLEQGVEEGSIRTWQPLKLKRRVVFEEES